MSTDSYIFSSFEFIEIISIISISCTEGKMRHVLAEHLYLQCRYFATITFVKIILVNLINCTCTSVYSENLAAFVPEI